MKPVMFLLGAIVKVRWALRWEPVPVVLVSRGDMTVEHPMSVKAAYRNGVFEPLEKVEGAKPGTVYTVFSDDELHELGEMFGWLKAAEKSFDFWNNPVDAVYDTL